MKLQDHNIARALTEALTSPLGPVTEERDGLPVVAVEGVECAVDTPNRVIRTGSGKDQRWYEVHLRDVTPKRFLTPEEQTEIWGRDDDPKDWWIVSSSARTVFVRCKTRYDAIMDFLRRFPGEAAFGQAAPEAQVARGMQFIDDEGDRLREEKIAEVHEEGAPQPLAPEWPESPTFADPAADLIGGDYRDPTEEDEDKELEELCSEDPKDYYFCINLGEEFGGDADNACLMVCPKKYWDENKVAFDGHCGDIWKKFPKSVRFPEDMECTWYIPDGILPEEVAIDMVCAGFERNLELEGVVESVMET